MGQVGGQPDMGGGTRAGASPWHSPHPETTPAQTPLMSLEIRQAMAEWTARPTAMTSRPSAPLAARDDSSSASLSQEQIMEEVRKQLQVAMVGRDAEVKDLRSQNSELRQALETSAQLLSEVMAAGGSSDPGPQPQEARGGHPGSELGGQLPCEGQGSRESREAPPGFYESARVSGGNPFTQGMAANAATSMVGGLSDRLFGQGGSPPRVDPGGKFGMPQFGPPGDQQAQETLSADESSPLNILVQGMRQLQQVYMEKKGGADHEALKSTELPALPELTGDTGVEFSDWLYVAEQTIGAMSDSASLWYEKTLACVREAYSRYQGASPLERLTIGPRTAPELLEPKWVRLDRKVMTLILAAMPKTVREDAVTHRVSSVSAVPLRLHILYSPGGIAERTAVLKHLEGHSAGDQVVDAIAALRRWKRHLTRCQEMLLSVPEASILLRGLEVTVAACVQKHPEMSFRLSLARNELQLQSRPTQESVMKFYDHLMAELQQALPAKWSLKGSSGTSDPPKVRAIGAGTGEASTTTSPTGSPTRASQRSTAATTPCKFFASDAGCKRGQACKFQHEFQGKDDKRARCWHCGSKQHRQNECPIKEGAKRTREAATSSSSTTTSRPAPTVAAVQPVEPKATVPAAPVKDNLGTSVLGSEVGGEQRQGVVVAEPVGLNSEGGAQGPEIQAFMKEVNTMLQRLTRLSSMKVVDSLEPEIKRVEASMAGFASAQDGVALLDSGATHPFKPLVEKDLADIVQVQLADGQKVDLQQNRAGTLMPVKNSSLDRANFCDDDCAAGHVGPGTGLHGGLGQARPTCSASRAWRVDHSRGGLVPLYRGGPGTSADRGEPGNWCS